MFGRRDGNIGVINFLFPKDGKVSFHYAVWYNVKEMKEKLEGCKMETLQWIYFTILISFFVWRCNLRKLSYKGHICKLGIPLQSIPFLASCFPPTIYTMIIGGPKWNASSYHHVFIFPSSHFSTIEHTISAFLMESLSFSYCNRCSISFY